MRARRRGPNGAQGDRRGRRSDLLLVVAVGDGEGVIVVGEGDVVGILLAGEAEVVVDGDEEAVVEDVGGVDRGSNKRLPIIAI